MIFSLSRWRPRHLLFAWCAYWIGLIVVGLGPAIAAGYRLSQHVHAHGTASVNFGNDAFSGTISDAGVTTWSGHISFLTLFLLVGVPPLILWIAWLVAASRTKHAGKNAVVGPTEQQLYAADVDRGLIEPLPKRTRAPEV